MKRILFLCAVCACLLPTFTARANGAWGLWSAGDNYWGELGTGTTTNSATPEAVISSNAVVAVAAGYQHGLFIKTDGSLWGMGRNDDGQLGYEGGSNAVDPPSLLVSNGVAAAAGGWEHSLWIMTNGSLWGMGYELYGQLGDGSYGVGHTPPYSTNMPEMILSNNVSQVAAGQDHSLFIKTDGSLWVMGDDQSGQLGDGQPNGFDYNYTNEPQMIVPSGVMAIAGGGYHSMFTESNGSLWVMGDNSYGQLGIGPLPSYTNRPTMIESSNVTAVAAGFYFSLYLKNDGTLWAMGDNSYGQFGNGTTTSNSLPTQVPSVSNVVAIAAGQYSSAFIKSDGSLWTMGANASGCLGAGLTNSQSLVPVEVTSSNVATVAYGGQTLYFLQTIILPPPQIGVRQGGATITNGQTNVINFGSVVTNRTGAILIFTVTNSGGQTLDLTGVSVPAGFTIDTNPPSAVAPDSSGTFSVQLVTTALGTNSGNIVITNSDPVNGTFTFPVSGTVVASLPPAQIGVLQAGTAITNGQTNAINFGSVVSNQTGAILIFTVTNSGGQTLDLTGVSVPTGFVIPTNPPNTIVAGSAGTFSVQLVSTNLGIYSGDIVITNSDPSNGLFSFAVTGTVTTAEAGAPAIALSGDLAFGVIGIGSSAHSTLTISNSGTVTLNVSNITTPSGFGVSWSNGPIAAGGTQPVSVTFSPLSAIAYGGTITVISDAASGVGRTTATGFGANPSLVLTVLIDGLGKVTPPLSGEKLKLDTKYTLTAVPDANWIFSGWTGSIVTNKNPLSFLMHSNTVLQANFSLNPFYADKGSFNGLFYQTNGVTEQTAGMLKSLSITTKGTYTASLLINGATRPISGVFSLDDQTVGTVKRPAAQGGNLTVRLTLASSNSVPQITGTVTGTNNGAAWTAYLLADLATNTLPSGEFTMLMPPDTNNAPPALSPGGDSYALITNNGGTLKNPSSANAKITGALADGTAFNQTVPVASDGSVPVYASLYGGKGLLLGWINLDLTNPAAAESSSLTWIHPSEKSGLYKAGFTNVLLTNEIQISAWTNPPADLGELTNIAILDTINDTNALANFVMAISPAGKVTGTEVTGTLALKTGLLKLTVGGRTNKVAATGVILPNNGIAAGYILTKTNSQAFQVK